MFKRIVATALLAVLATAVHAEAGRVVMFLTDSRGNTGNATRFPALVDTARADFTVCLNYQNGRRTAQGISAFEAAYTTCTASGDVTDVVFLLGVNDLLDGVLPPQTAANLRTLQGMAEAHGARGWIMTQCPAPKSWGGIIPANREVWKTRTELFDNGPRTHLLDSMYEFTMTAWYASTCSSDELHPSGLPCREALAVAPTNLIPCTNALLLPPACTACINNGTPPACL